jgi:CheY-like chemotaxis protein/nitrogen-specific signal transduction histidine kinase
VCINSNGCFEEGRFVYSRCFTRDVTEKVLLEEQLRDKLAEVDQLNRRKDEFLAMLGHELRNPLAAIQNAILAAQQDGASRDRALPIARRQTEQLRRLVDDLLDITRITQGRFALRKERLSLAFLVERAVEAVRALVESRRHELSVIVGARDAWIQADATRLEQLIVNLLTNAAKYTDPGGWIRIQVDREGSEGLLRVADSGIGIDREKLANVFDMFTQLHHGIDRAPGGLGVGLTIARQIAELHGGRIEASSEGLGKGSEFTLRLPLSEEGGVAVASSDVPLELSPSQKRVLIVEDRHDNAAVLAMLLEMLGHEVHWVHSGEEAVAFAKMSPPDVMLVDIGLPDIDGYEVARRVLAQPDRGQIVLVALTGYGQEQDRARAFAAGFDHHVVKPMDSRTIDQILGTCRGGRDGHGAQSRS